MKRSATVQRKTKETEIQISLALDGKGTANVSTGLPFFDHMLALFSVHGFLDLTVAAQGDLEVDPHHTVEDVGLVLGDTLQQALGERKGIRRYGYAVIPMDDALAMVTIDLSNRPYLVYKVSGQTGTGGVFDISLAREFFRAFATRAGMNLHINVPYGENEHHMIEAIFKAAGRALDQAVAIDGRLKGIPSTKGML
jgi:imidazoleglycerol-phosphate dehydratase